LIFFIQIEPADVQLVEENLSLISYKEHNEIRSSEAANEYKEESPEEPRICLPISQNQEQTPIYLRTNSIGIDAQESSSEETQLVNEISTKPEHQIGQNIESVRVLFNTNTITKYN